MIAAPCELHEFVVGRTTENNCVTVFEIRSQTCEFSDFGWADKSEVLRVEEDDLPFAFEACFGNFFKSRNAVFFVEVEARLNASYFERRKLVTDTEHLIPACKFVVMQKIQKFQN